jgi:AcrR family transcriptional regulator
MSDPCNPPLTGKAASQERILEAAMQSGVSRATVFWHFSDKKSL